MTSYQPSDPYRNLVVALLRTSGRLDNSISKFLKKFAITHVQFNILRILQTEYPEAIFVGSIKEKLLFANSDMTRLLDRLVAKELVERFTYPENRRKVNVKLSPQGVILLEQILPELTQLIHSFFPEKLSETEIKQVGQTLGKIKV
ncbi:MAG: MarR family transcriptional regulator [Spirochaetota bacterium]